MRLALRALSKCFFNDSIRESLNWLPYPCTERYVNNIKNVSKITLSGTRPILDSGFDKFCRSFGLNYRLIFKIGSENNKIRAIFLPDRDSSAPFSEFSRVPCEFHDVYTMVMTSDWHFVNVLLPYNALNNTHTAHYTEAAQFTHNYGSASQRSSPLCRDRKFPRYT